MKKLLLVLVFGVSLIAHDLIVKESSCSVDKTIESIQSIVKTRGLNIFAIIDHNKNARSVDKIMPESKLIIFGNPKIGTDFMLEEMKVGLDIPMRVLVYKDKDEKVKIVYRDGTWLVETHKLTITSREQKINEALDKITDEARTCTKD